MGMPLTLGSLLCRHVMWWVGPGLGTAFWPAFDQVVELGLGATKGQMVKRAFSQVGWKGRKEKLSNTWGVCRVHPMASSSVIHLWYGTCGLTCLVTCSFTRSTWTVSISKALSK